LRDVASSSILTNSSRIKPLEELEQSQHVYSFSFRALRNDAEDLLKITKSGRLSLGPRSAAALAAAEAADERESLANTLRQALTRQVGIKHNLQAHTQLKRR
jgi:hypothetical protein